MNSHSHLLNLLIFLCWFTHNLNSSELSNDLSLNNNKLEAKNKKSLIDKPETIHSKTISKKDFKYVDKSHLNYFKNSNFIKTYQPTNNYSNKWY